MRQWKGKKRQQEMRRWNLKRGNPYEDRGRSMALGSLHDYQRYIAVDRVSITYNRSRAIAILYETDTDSKDNRGSDHGILRPLALMH